MNEQTNVTPTTPVQAPAPSAQTAQPAAGVSLLTTCLIAAAFSAFSSFTAWHFASQNAPGTPVAMIDAAKLANLKMEKTLAQPGVTGEQAAAEGKRFAQQLNKTLEAYSNAGVVVINSSVAMNRPAGNDITAEVAGQLGIALTK
jgi:hypothetical protein